MVGWLECCSTGPQDQVKRNRCLLLGRSAMPHLAPPPGARQHFSHLPLHYSPPHACVPPFTHLEDGCLRVVVDGHNHLAVLNASNMLDGTTDAHSYVQLRCNNLAGLTNLQPAAGGTQSQREFRQMPQPLPNSGAVRDLARPQPLCWCRQNEHKPQQTPTSTPHLCNQNAQP